MRRLACASPSNLNNAFYNSSFGTLFFRKAAGGTYIVTASSSDPDTPLAAGNAAYTFTPVTGNNFTGVQTGGQVSYTFTTTATQPAAARTVVATNLAAGVSAAASYTAILDSTAPTGGALRSPTPCSAASRWVRLSVAFSLPG